MNELRKEFEKEAAIISNIKKKGLSTELNLEDVPAYVKEMQITLTNSLLIQAEKQTLTLKEIIARFKRSGIADNEIKNILLKDLREGGQLFGDFRKGFKATIKQGIEEHARKEVEQLDSDLWDWLGIVDGSICPDCLDRHNMPAEKFEYWESIGLPGAGATVCDKNCRCVLVPANSVIKENGGLKRDSKS